MEISMIKNDGLAPRTSSPFWLDRTLWVLFLSNLFTGIMAVMENWKVGDLIWIYWGQSVIIGIFNVKRMLALRTFSVEGLKLNGNPVTADRKTQVSMAVSSPFTMDSSTWPTLFSWRRESWSRLQNSPGSETACA